MKVICLYSCFLLSGIVDLYSSIVTLYWQGTISEITSFRDSAGPEGLVTGGLISGRLSLDPENYTSAGTILGTGVSGFRFRYIAGFELAIHADVWEWNLLGGAISFTRATFPATETHTYDAYSNDSLGGFTSFPGYVGSFEVGFGLFDRVAPLDLVDDYGTASARLRLEEVTDGSGFVTSRLWDNPSSEIVDGYYIAYEIEHVSFAPIPEPGPLLLAAVGLPLIVLFRLGWHRVRRNGLPSRAISRLLQIVLILVSPFSLYRTAASVPAGDLKPTMRLPEGVLRSPDADSGFASPSRFAQLARLNTQLASRDFAEAERTALDMLEEARRANPADDSAVAACLNLAAFTAFAQQEYAKANSYLEQAMRLTNRGKHATHWMETQLLLAALKLATGDFSAASEVLQDTIDVQAEQLGSEHPATLKSRLILAVTKTCLGRFPEAEKEHRALLAVQEGVLGPDAPDTLWNRIFLAISLAGQGKTALAESEIRPFNKEHQGETLDEDLGVQFYRVWLADFLEAAGRYPEAMKQTQAALDGRTRSLGPEDPYTLQSRSRRACLHWRLGQYRLALEECREVVALQEKRLGSDHPDTLATRTTLAVALHDSGDFEDAEREHRTVFVSREKLLGSEDPGTLGSRMGVALALSGKGDDKSASIELREILEIQERVLGQEDPQVLRTRNNLANALIGLRRLDEAKLLLSNLVDIRKRTLGEDHPSTLSGRHNLANVLNQLGEHRQALEEIQKVATTRERVLGLLHPETINSRSNLALVYFDMGSFSEALTEYQLVLDRQISTLGPEQPPTLGTRLMIVSTLFAIGRYEEVEKECDALMEPVQRIFGPGENSRWLRSKRLASIERQLGKNHDSLKQLNSLKGDQLGGELKFENLEETQDFSPLSNGLWTSPTTKSP